MTTKSETSQTTPPAGQASWLKRNAAKLVALAFWLVLFAGYQTYAWVNQLTPFQAVQALLHFFASSRWGPVIYALAYALSPLILFPSTLLTLAGGFVFGPVWGLGYTLLASNLSATVAYLVGHYFGKGLFKEDGATGLLQRYARRLRANSFETLMVMRLIFLPYEWVSYLAGLLRIRYWSFIVATALGSIPGTLAFVGFGASIVRFDGALPKLNPITLGVSIAIFMVSLALSRLFKKQEGISK